MNDNVAPAGPQEPAIERPQSSIEPPPLPPMTFETVIYRLDDATLEITSGIWNDMGLMEPEPLPQNLITDLFDGRLMVYPGFTAYYHREEAFLKDMKLDIEIVRDYTDTKKRIRTPCYVMDMTAITELSPEIIRHIFNVRRGRAPV